uniref:Neural cell adhesion molecule 2 n=1 Tax=Sinocyclocheilus grahami TaxID=75366 RepID=A0A672LDM9_SINGR
IFVLVGTFLLLLLVSISLKKVELSVGESKFFTCTVIGEPVSLDWYNPQGERMVPSQRVALHNEGFRSRLTLYNAKIEDAGIYRCQASDAQGHTQEATVVLEIYQKLTFRDVRSPQEFRQGDVAEVVCDVSSSPVPVVSWFYNNVEIIEDTEKFQLLQNNNLQVQRVTKADEGVYRCEARVEARGEIDFRDIILVVNVPPVVSVPQQSFNATADYGESVTFTCRAYGSPEPDITWHRYDKLITIAAKSGSCTTLTVRNIQHDDGGSYTCKASNKAGEVEHELFLKVFGEDTFFYWVSLIVYYVTAYFALVLCLLIPLSFVSCGDNCSCGSLSVIYMQLKAKYGISAHNKNLRKRVFTF